MSAATLGDPIYVETQVVAGINYRSFHVCGWLVRARVIAAVHFGSSLCSCHIFRCILDSRTACRLQSTPLLGAKASPSPSWASRTLKRKSPKLPSYPTRLTCTWPRHNARMRSRNSKSECNKWVSNYATRSCVMRACVRAIVLLVLLLRLSEPSRCDASTTTARSPTAQPTPPSWTSRST